MVAKNSQEKGKKKQGKIRQQDSKGQEKTKYTGNINSNYCAYSF